MSAIHSDEKKTGLKHDPTRVRATSVAGQRTSVTRTIGCALVIGSTLLLGHQQSEAQEAEWSATANSARQQARGPSARVARIDPHWDDDRDHLWTAGETIRIAVQFTRDVRVDTTNGTPSIGVLPGGKTGFAARMKRAEYTETVGVKRMFTYRVTAADGVVRAIKIPENTLRLNGGWYRR